MIDLLDDHLASIEAYRFLLSTQTVKNNPELVKMLLHGLELSTEALLGIR